MRQRNILLASGTWTSKPIFRHLSAVVTATVDGDLN